MRVMCLILALVLVMVALGTSGAQVSLDMSHRERTVMTNVASLPLAFTENKGQFGMKTLYKADAGGASFFFCRDEVVYLFVRATDAVLDEGDAPFPGAARMLDTFEESRYRNESVLIKVKFLGAHPDPEVVGADELPHKSNYFYGNDPSEWQTNVPNYSAIVYRDIYRGIDLKYYGDGHSMKYDFIVQPGADLSQIRIRYEGVQDLTVSTAGDLKAFTRFGPVGEKAPRIYQEVGGRPRELKGRYELAEPGVFGFVIEGDYDASTTLVIDPALVYSTYLGGTSKDWGFGIAIGNLGAACVTGYTWSDDFDTAGPLNPYQGSRAGGKDVFVSKLNQAGTQLVYSTYLGGQLDDCGTGIKVDASDYAYVTGYTKSASFPTEVPYQPGLDGEVDGFVVKLSQMGDDLIYGTYLGGSSYDACHDIAVDGSGSAHVAGMTYSTDFDSAGGPVQGTNGGYWDAFVTKLSASGNSLVYSTYLGGSYIETAYGITIDDLGCAYVTGWTWSEDFPTESPYDGTLDGTQDAFLTKLESSGSSLLYSTYLGGEADDFGKGVAVDDEYCAYVTGRSGSGYFPKVNAYDSTLGGDLDGFVTKFTPDGSSIVYSTYLGGSFDEYANSIALDNNAQAYVTGMTKSTDFDTTGGAHQGENEGSWDAFLTKFSATGNSLEYSTYLGGGADDFGYGVAIHRLLGNAYLTGKTESDDFDTTPAAYQGSYEGNYDAFVAQFLTGLNFAPEAIIDSIAPNPADSGSPVTFGGHGVCVPPDSVVAYHWESDIDGYLSPNASFSTDALSVGQHSISFRVKNSSLIWSDEVVVSLRVTGVNAPPVAFIDDIDPNPQDLGNPVSFTGHGEDVDGYIGGWEWTSSIDGYLDSTSSFSADTLKAGAHVIHFRVRDDLGAWSKDTTALLSVVEPLGEEWQVSWWADFPGEDFAVEMHDSYKCTLLTSNLSQVTQTLDYGLSMSYRPLSWFGGERTPDWDFGEDSDCKVNGATYSLGSPLTEGIDADKTHEYVFAPSNSWNWIEPWNLWRVASIVIDVAWSAAPPILEPVVRVYDWYNFFQVLEAFYCSVPQVEYTYTGMNDADDGSSHSVVAYVRPEKILFFWGSFLLGDIASDLTSAGFACLSMPPPGQAIAAALFVAEAVTYGCSEKLYVMSVDPDSNYTQMVYSVGEWEGPSLDDIEDGWWKDIAATTIGLYLVSTACETSYTRYLGALKAGSADWALKQLGATTGYVEEQISLTEDLKTLVEDHLSEIAIPTAEDISAVRDSIQNHWNHGVPAKEYEFMSYLSFPDSSIERMADSLYCASDSYYTHFDSLLSNLSYLDSALHVSSRTLLLHDLAGAALAEVEAGLDTLMQFFPVDLCVSIQGVHDHVNYEILPRPVLNGADSAIAWFLDDCDEDGLQEFTIQFASVGGSSGEQLLSVSGQIVDLLAGDTLDFSGATVVTVGELSGVPGVPPAEVTHLHPSTPNPFGPPAEIRFTLSRPERVTLRIYNVSGELVAEILAGAWLEAGPHTVLWDGRNTAGRAVATGVYLCRLTTASCSETRKMLLLK